MERRDRRRVNRGQRMKREGGKREGETVIEEIKKGQGRVTSQTNMTQSQLQKVRNTCRKAIEGRMHKVQGANIVLRKKDHQGIQKMLVVESLQGKGW